MTEHDSPVQSVSDQAAEWFIRLKDRDLSASDRRRYVRWLKHSPSHISEFIRVCQLYSKVKRAQVPPILPDGEQSNIVDLVPRTLPPPMRRERRFFDARSFRLAAVACSALLAGVIGLTAKHIYFDNRIETQISEWRQFQLADGTIVNAGPRTSLQVDFSKERRSVRLLRGEAMFQVVKDPSRPFLVNADFAVARAVGTKFGVTRSNGNVVVTVAEGKVAVARGDQAARLSSTPASSIEQSIAQNVVVAVIANEQVSVSEAKPALPLQVARVDAARELAWARGELVFESVGEAIHEFNRRNRTQIEVDDPAIAAWHVCCEFDAADPEGFAEWVAETVPEIALVRERPGVVKLVAEQPQPN